jgi:uncharacterized protein (DUF2147 family)
MEFMDQHGIEYNKVQGMYEGNGEESFVLKNTPKNAEIVQKFAEKFNQDSVLHTDKEGNANLIFKDRKEPIGKVREITPEEAKGMTAYTFDPASGKYYSTQEPQNAISNGTKAMKKKGHIGNSPKPKSKAAGRKQIIAIALSKEREAK